MDLDPLPCDPLPLHLCDRRIGERFRDGLDAKKRVDAKRLIDPLRALGGNVGESHAIGRKQR